MDTLTHALTGALLAGAVARPTPGEPPLRAQMAAASVAAAFPDADFVLRAFGTLVYLNAHQGITHSLLLLPLWAALLAYAFQRLAGRRYRWRGFLVPAALGIAAHIAVDAITAYGTMLLAPLSARRYSLPLVFVIDPWFTGIAGAGLAASSWLPWRRTVAAAALAAVAGYAALLGTLQGQAMGLGRAHATASGWPEAAVHALPQPLSPFHWKIVLREGDRYRVTDVELRGAPARAIVDPEAGWLDRLAAGYRPPSAANWRAQALTGDDAAEAALARAAWHDPALAGFRRFAMFPALEAVRTEGARHCVRFLDLRFALPGLPAAFRYEACRQARGGSWELRRVRGAFGID